MVRLEALIQRADELIAKAGEVLQTARGEYRQVDNELFREFRSSALSFLGSTFGKNHVHYTEFDKEVKHLREGEVEEGRGILKAAREEMAGGWLNTVKALVSGEIFADFLEMANHLLENDYKDAAAVIAGSTLEEHLRQLSKGKAIAISTTRKGRQVPKTADKLNAELSKAGAYNALDQKSVTAWLGLRNRAAHGEYGEYAKEQVVMMVQGIRDFMVRNQP